MNGSIIDDAALTILTIITDLPLVEGIRQQPIAMLKTLLTSDVRGNRNKVCDKRDII
jgi:hypothetical protein